MLLTILIAASLLSGCSLLLEAGDNGWLNSNLGSGNNSNNDESDTLSQEALEREAMVRELKVSRYFDNIKNDPMSLATFINQMPKGGDVRLLPSLVVDATEITSALPFSDSEFRHIVSQAIMQHIGYLEIVANLTPAQILQLDSVQSQVLRNYSLAGIEHKLTINYLAAVSADYVGMKFEDELDAALGLYEASDRVVGIVILPATTLPGYDSFSKQM